MARLENVTVDDLRGALEEVEGKKPALRLVAAIAYKNGVSQTELAEWFDVQRRTIYGWFTRLEAEPLEQAVRDADRSGRPRKLSEEQQDRLREALQHSPTQVGYDARSWRPALVQRYLAERFDVEYSRPSCRRLMKEAGLRYRRPRRSDTLSLEDGAGESGTDLADTERFWLPE